MIVGWTALLSWIMDVRGPVLESFSVSLQVTPGVPTSIPTVVDVSVNVDNQLSEEKKEKEKTCLTDSRITRSDPLRKGYRRFLILGLLCSAQFFGIFNTTTSSVIIALPELSSGASPWVKPAYTLTFAGSFLFASRLTDIYHPKLVFCYGYLMMGLLSVLCGVSDNPIMLLIFRGLQGLGAALASSSALVTIVGNFPDPAEQSQAFDTFGIFGAMGSVLGFLLGGIITARLDMRQWIFYLVGIACTHFAVLSFFVIPKYLVNDGYRQSKLHWQGVVPLSSGGLILLVYALANGNYAGWAKPQVIVILVLFVVFMAAFFFIEWFVNYPAIPTSAWRIRDFLPLLIYCWSLYWFVNGIELQLIQIFQNIWGWSPLTAAIHCLPIGISGGICRFLAERYVSILPRKLQLVFAQVLLAISAIIYVFVDTPDKYWSHVLPGMVICMTGVAMGYNVSVNVFILENAPKDQEEIISAMLSTAYQIGTTVGLAFISAIASSFDDDQHVSPMKGYRASFWYLLVLNAAMIFVSLAFVR